MIDLSLRDIFAISAMHALVSKYGERLPDDEDPSGGESAHIAELAYGIADCMVRERVADEEED